jgi:hypothetical protein
MARQTISRWTLRDLNSRSSRDSVPRLSLMSFEYRLSPDDCAAKLEIIDLLSRFGRLQFNILPEGAGSFYWDEFVSSKEFFDTFPKKLGERANAFLGDIFVRTS